MSQLYLVGSVHLDVLGPKRLEKLLLHLKPDALATEFDKDRVATLDEAVKLLEDPEVVEKSAKHLKENYFPHGNHETLKQMLKTDGFEYTIAKKYASQHNIPLVFADTIHEKEMVDAFLTKGAETNERMDTFLSYSPEKLAQEVAQLYANSGDPRGFTDEQIANTSEFNLIHERDKRTEQFIRGMEGETQIYICGIPHIFGGKEYYREHPNLFDRLQDLNPKRIKLNEADKF